MRFLKDNSVCVYVCVSFYDAKRNYDLNLWSKENNMNALIVIDDKQVLL